MSTSLLFVTNDGSAAETTDARQRRPRGAVRDGLVAAGLELAPALDLVAQLTGHLAMVERRDAGFVLATLGGRFKWR